MSNTKLLLHLDGNIVDSSTSNHVLTNTGVQFLSRFNGSIYVAGNNNSYVSIANSSDWAFINQPFTIDFWIKTNQNTNGLTDNICAIFSMCDSNPDSNDLIIFMNNFGRIRVWSATGIDKTGQLVINDNNWHHLAIVKDSDSKVTLYVDGSADPQLTQVSCSSYFTNKAIILGMQNSVNRPFLGYLDEVRISKGIARWTSNFTPPTEAYITDSNTKLLLHFDGNVTDSSGTDKNVTNNGVTFTPYKFSTSCYFNGSTCLKGITDANKINFSGDWTIDFWILANAQSSTRLIFAYENDCLNSVGLNIAIGTSDNNWNASNANKLKVAFNYTSSWQHQVNSNSIVTTGNWKHVAIVRTKSTNNLKIFIDGVLDTNTTITNSDVSTKSYFLVGSNCYNSPDRLFTGYLDELRVTNNVVWTTNFTPPTSPYTINTSPIAPPISTITVKKNQYVNIILPAFSDPDNDIILHNLNNLPSGLIFDSTTRTIKGYTNSIGQKTMTYTGNDGQGGITNTGVTIVVEDNKDEVGKNIKDVWR